MLDLAFQPDRGDPAPIYRQLEGYLRELIAARRLPPGERLPASRELAQNLGLSRNTVNQAYQALTDDGLLRAHVGQGTFVAPPRPDAEPPPPRPVSRGFAWSGLFARRTRAVTLPPAFQRESGGRTGRFDFRAGQVDPESLPTQDLKRAFARVLDRDLRSLAEPPDPRGWPPLRQAIAQSLVARGIRCAPEEIAITSGAQQALDLVARVLVDPGDTVVMEQPGYFGAALAFGACEAHRVGVGVDGEGLRTEELSRILRARRVKLLYTTPAVQSPTGVCLSHERRGELLALADEYQLPLVEDDYDSELRYDAGATPALKNVDDAGRVIYLGTFSKALFAGLRVGYVVAPQPLLWRLVLSRWAADFGSNTLAQAALAELLGDGGLERHVRRVRKIYAERRTAMLAALEAHMPEGTRWNPPAGGNTVWVTLPPGADPTAVYAAAAEDDLHYTRGDAFFFDGEGARHLCLSFAKLTEPDIKVGIERLAALVRGSLTSRRAAQRRYDA